MKKAALAGRLFRGVQEIIVQLGPMGRPGQR